MDTARIESNIKKKLSTFEKKTHCRTNRTFPNIIQVKLLNKSNNINNLNKLLCSGSRGNVSFTLNIVTTYQREKDSRKNNDH